MIQVGEEGSQETEMGGGGGGVGMTLFGSFRWKCACRVTAGQQVGQAGCSPVRVALGCGGRRASWIASGASGELVWWKGQESDVECPGFATY